MRTSILAAFATIALVGPALAQDAGVVNVYNWQEYIADDTIPNFQAETGITVRYDVYASNEELEGKLSPGNSGYDLVFPSGSFLERQIEAGFYQPIDRSRLTNYGNLDPVVLEQAAVHDAGNAHSIPYMSFTVGLGYNVDKVAERLGDAPPDSWDLLLDPENAAKLADCGILILESPSEVVSSVLNYLGLDPNSESAEDLAKAEEALMAIRPHVRNFDSTTYIDLLASGEVCLVVGYSGDVLNAASSAEEAGQGVNVAYLAPKEGVLTAFDLMAIPADAPNVDNVYKFIDYMLQPEVTAAISNAVYFASANKEALAFVDEDVRNNPGVYPPAEVVAESFGVKAHSAAFDRLLNRTWTRIKTGR